jgi:membrane associated rhomboid family serine protease
MMTEPAPVPAQPASRGIPLPIHKPVVTYVLLGAIGVVFVVELLVRTFLRSDLIFGLGAQRNSLVGAAQHWRLMAAMFLHSG